MSPGAKAAILSAYRLNLAQLADNAAWYSLAGAPSDSTYLLNAGNVTLIADRSPNSRVNGLVLNGVSGQYASSPDSAAVSVTGDCDFVVSVAADNWAPGTIQTFIAKRGSSQESYQFRLNTSHPELVIWNGGVASVMQASAVPTIANFASLWLKVSYQSASTSATFYTSPDGITWTQLGTVISLGGNRAIDDKTSLLTVGGYPSGEVLTGRISRAQVYNGIGGTLVFDANFTTVAKLATSFTESSSNAATVTINTSGDLGARISGARDLVQLTAAKQPAFSVVGGYNTATFDGSNDYMKSQAWSQPQPSSFYVTMSQVTWTDTDYFWDSFTADAASAFQRTSTPGFQIYSGGASTRNDNLPVATKGIISALYSGAASTSRVNLGATIAGASVGTAAAGGFCVGAAAGGSAPGNITFNEALLRSTADSSSTQLQIAGYFIKKWNVTP